eukprot:CAMPEP_0119472656 /NCGR_PEP_ID=MMETSP1344-20130328/4620_1 /TAXON_ID=236787 /ORGANISM="Florenciella parvula, Strain CCMP2471" /LENGTH=607 /DNA_ID=CAMNT_0007505629 /DNA_START=42 /DNA_END=1865 /DNA_ORIENTATION=-
MAAEDNQIGHDEGLYKTLYFDYEDEVEAKMKEQELFFAVTSGQSEDKEAEEQEKVFRDPDFDAVASSLYRNPFQAPRGALPPGMIEWNSVGGLEVEAIDQPALFKQTNVERKQSDAMLGTPTGNTCQGALKNCWFVGACAVLASKPEMVKALFVSAAYADQGLYTLRMYKSGLLRYVHVDDRLPCNQAGALHYARGLDINEVWVPIVEKAYAKMHGCYENLVHGKVELALKDLTGLPPFKLDLTLDDVGAWDQAVQIKGLPNQLMCAEYQGKGTPGSGILAGHAYIILDLVEVHADATADFDAIDLKMVRLRNPWGIGRWGGAWANEDRKWVEYPEIKDKLAPLATKWKSEADKDAGGDDRELESLQKGEDEFWMDWRDFVRHFTCIAGVFDVKGEEGQQVRYRGQFIPGDSKSGGGGAPGEHSWPQNPQYGIEVDQITTVAATVSCLDYRWQLLPGAAYDAQIGFVVMALTGTKIRSTKFHPLKMKGQSIAYQVAPAMTGLCTLQPGRYAIVPSTIVADQRLKFTLEISTSKPVNLESENDNLPDADDLEESDDEELGTYDDPGILMAPPEKMDPENDGKELEALSYQANDLAGFIKTLQSDVKVS